MKEIKTVKDWIKANTPWSELFNIGEPISKKTIKL